MKKSAGILFALSFFVLGGCGNEANPPEVQRNAVGCQLGKPIDIGTNDPRIEYDSGKIIKLTDVVFHQKPRTVLLRENFHEDSKLWSIKFYEIQYNHKPSGFLGYYIAPQQTENVGFAIDYIGTFPIAGKADHVGVGFSFLTSEQAGEADSKNELKVTTSGNNITSIEITVPLYVAVESPSPSSGVMQYKGNETLCVKSATLKN